MRKMTLYNMEEMLQDLLNALEINLLSIWDELCYISMSYHTQKQVRGGLKIY